MIDMHCIMLYAITFYSSRQRHENPLEVCVSFIYGSFSEENPPLINGRDTRHKPFAITQYSTTLRYLSYLVNIQTQPHTRSTNVLGTWISSRIVIFHCLERKDSLLHIFTFLNVASGACSA